MAFTPELDRAIEDYVLAIQKQRVATTEVENLAARVRALLRDEVKASPFYGNAAVETRSA